MRPGESFRERVDAEVMVGAVEVGVLGAAKLEAVVVVVEAADGAGRRGNTGGPVRTGDWVLGESRDDAVDLAAGRAPPAAEGDGEPESICSKKARARAAAAGSAGGVPVRAGDDGAGDATGRRIRSTGESRLAGERATTGIGV